MHFGAVQEFQGLNFTTDVRSATNIAALVGRNGAGKSRLLKAIAEGKVEVFLNDKVVPQGSIRLLQVTEIQPSLTFHFDALQQRERQRESIALYHQFKGKFLTDASQSIATLGQINGGRSRHTHINQVCQVVALASSILGIGPNDLADEDIADFCSEAAFATLGALNVTETMRVYWDRINDNDFNEFRNTVHGESLPHRKAEEFRARFGPPPWEVFNYFLREVLSGRYHIKAPTRTNIATYSAQIYRSEDDLPIDPSWLSSGEKVLMWLCLSMYATTNGHVSSPPKLILLDEPDGVLHPQMVQKLHRVLESIANTFGSGIIFTTHSPTSVALFNAGPIWQVSEREVSEIDKDAAISELLVGLDQVLIHYTKCKQVYVESQNDEEVYTELFTHLRRWDKGVSQHIALSFIPAAPKLPEKNVRDLLRAHLGDVPAERFDAFVQALNGQGDCVQVEGAVESLNTENGVPVHGIIDWDATNKAKPRIHVLGAELFYSIENAVLNPLTLGLYLLHNFLSQLAPADYGLPDGFDGVGLYNEPTHWQSIADGVTKRVLGLQDVRHDVACLFLSGASISFDKRYVHMNGHDLEARLRQGHAYPFLNRFNKRPTLLMDVVQQGIRPSQGRTMPHAFVELFLGIQQAL